MPRFPNSFHVRGLDHLLLFNSDLFTQEIPNEIILLWMDYDVVLRLEETEKQNSISHTKKASQGFGRKKDWNRGKFIGFNFVTFS